MYQRKDKRGVAPLGQPQQMVQTAAPAQHAVIQDDPSALDMIKQQAMGKVAGTAIDKGMAKAGEMYTGSALESGVNSLLGPLAGSQAATTAGTAATTGAAGAGAMGAMSAAMPWLGAGLLGGKLLGFFSKGGLVGPLAGIKYKSNGGEVSDEYQVKFVSPLSAKE